MIIEWLLMGVLTYGGHSAMPIQQTYSTQAECEAARKMWEVLTPEYDVMVRTVCVKKVKT
jgi:hypothetical protein